MPTFRIALKLALLALLLFLVQGCAHTRAPLTPTQRVTLGFENHLQSAAKDFYENVTQAHKTLAERVDSAVESMGPSLDELVEQLDSYRQRTIPSQSDRAKIDTWLNTEIQSSIVPLVLEFYQAYAAEVQDLQSRLLVQTDLNPLLESSRPDVLNSINTINFPGSENDLTGSTARKGIEDAATFIPLAGDAYDIFRSFIYDPRLASTKQAARKCLPKLRAVLHQRLLDPLANQLPTAQQVAAACRKSFSAPQALQTLAEERQQNPRK